MIFEGSLQVRVAQAEDYAKVAEIWNEMIRDTHWTFTDREKTVDDLHAYARGPGDVFVATDQGAIVGFSAYGQFRNGPGYARSMEHSIVLSSEHRGKGAGAQLLTAVEDHARAQAYRTMVAGISSANERGRAFHLAMGYTHIGVLKEVGFKDGTWLDLILMQKLL